MPRSLILAVLFAIVTVFSGCAQEDPYYTTTEIKFLDSVTSQASPKEQFSSLPLSLNSGETATLTQLSAGKNLVVVFTRGFSGAVCPYCSAQTSSLVTQYEEFQKRNTEVVVIYPLNNVEDASRRGMFLERVNLLNQAPPGRELPFPLVVDFGLKAVDLLGIRKDLSKPATYILDSQGNVRFAYVGESLADRPSVKAILAQLDQLELATAPAPAPPSGP
jgi:peroxiredoxin